MITKSKTRTSFIYSRTIFNVGVGPFVSLATKQKKGDAQLVEWVTPLSTRREDRKVEHEVGVTL